MTVFEKQQQKVSHFFEEKKHESIVDHVNSRNDFTMSI